MKVTFEEVIHASCVTRAWPDMLALTGGPTSLPYYKRMGGPYQWVPQADELLLPWWAQELSPTRAVDHVTEWANKLPPSRIGTLVAQGTLYVMWESYKVGTTFWKFNVALFWSSLNIKAANESLPKWADKLRL